MGVLAEGIKAQRGDSKSFIQSLDKYLLSTCSISGIVPDSVMLQ